MLQALNKAMDYIEEHLADDLPLEAVAEHVGVSGYHFKTIFFYLTGMTLHEYIKRRRLAKANVDLLRGKKVTDVAFTYGYQSMDGFARAFKKWSGFLPSEIAKAGACKSFPQFSFVIAVQGGVSMEFRIEDKPAFYLAGVSKRVPMQFEGVNNAIVELAKTITQQQRNEMHALQNIAPCEIVNASFDSDTDFLKEEGELTHLIGVLTTQSQVGAGLAVVPVEAHTWAVFPNEGPFPHTLQETMAKTYSQWLPASNYEVVHAPSFSFTQMDAHKENYAYSEVWIPVREKE